MADSSGISLDDLRTFAGSTGSLLQDAAASGFSPATREPRWLNCCGIFFKVLVVLNAVLGLAVMIITYVPTIGPFVTTDQWNDECIEVTCTLPEFFHEVYAVAYGYIMPAVVSIIPLLLSIDVFIPDWPYVRFLRIPIVLVLLLNSALLLGSLACETGPSGNCGYSY